VSSGFSQVCLHCLFSCSIVSLSFAAVPSHLLALSQCRVLRPLCAGQWSDAPVVATFTICCTNRILVVYLLCLAVLFHWSFIIILCSSNSMVKRCRALILIRRMSLTIAVGASPRIFPFSSLLSYHVVTTVLNLLNIGYVFENETSPFFNYDIFFYIWVFVLRSFISNLPVLRAVSQPSTTCE
jgi:hypothetical protein